MNEIERLRRWQLAIGDEDQAVLSERDARLSAALSALYNAPPRNKGRGGLGASFSHIRVQAHLSKSSDIETNTSFASLGVLG